MCVCIFPSPAGCSYILVTKWLIVYVLKVSASKYNISSSPPDIILTLLTQVNNIMSAKNYVKRMRGQFIDSTVDIDTITYILYTFIVFYSYYCNNYQG